MITKKLVIVFFFNFFDIFCALNIRRKYTNLLVTTTTIDHQRWSPRGRPWPRGRRRGHNLKSLALASKVKSLALASRPQILENWPVLGSRAALFFELLKFRGDRLKNFCDWRSPEKFL